MKRRRFVSGIAAMVVTAHTAGAQQPRATKKLGVLAPWPPPPDVDADPFRMRLSAAFQGELRSQGWIEGQNLLVERRYAGGRNDLLPALASELVSLKVDVIYAAGGTAGLAAKKATSTVPIVTLSGDMIGQGLVSNLARPDGNVTGQNVMMAEVAGKRLHFLRELLPHASRIAVFGCGPRTNMGLSWPFVEAANKALKLQLLQYTPQTPDEFDAAVTEATRNHAEGLLVLDCPSFNAMSRTAIVRHRLPAIYYLELYAHRGGLMAYGPDEVAFNRRTAWYIGRILNGAKPVDLPVEQPTQFRLLINLKTARALNLTIPPALLLRADEVIE